MLPLEHRYRVRHRQTVVMLKQETYLLYFDSLQHLISQKVKLPKLHSNTNMNYVTQHHDIFLVRKKKTKKNRDIYCTLTISAIPL